MVTIGALVLYVVFVALGFGWRSWRQSRRTGSTGFRGISGRPGTPEWLAGVGFVVAMILGLLAPALQVVGGVSPIGAAEVPILQALGTVLAVTGIAGTLYAQNDMGESWRIGVDARETTTLVREGVFALVRNPIFTAMLVFATGIALMVPNVVALAALALLVASIEVQVRVVEEPHLMRVHGDSYQSYGQVVGRFLPMLGRLDRTE
ncbi:isoprenylcysteine carboxylmethyltransferase family protein [Mycobacterium hodleri]|uniref:Isoprenylcysteine carboxylmethyltransferase family protein n=2 Tax=Mycolicibacterium hodleri TaxID=49897 RepID=A0A544W6A6_9MYCO|nr:isoprenylcysteine carboxylmethyltransferase family protein [Mycolicibacterium hodleri]